MTHLPTAQPATSTVGKIDAELWAGKIYRAMDEHPAGMSEEKLVEATGLTLAQIELGVLWQNLNVLR